MLILLSVTSALWLALEVVLLVRDRARGTGGTARDRGTRVLNIALIVAAVEAASILADVTGRHSPWRIGHGWPAVAGFALVWLGLAVRVWAVTVLGRSFRTTVEVDAAQSVVSHGPYRWVRHPSYTGLLLITAGFGLGYGTWPGLALCLLLPEAAMMWRIRVEESELNRVLGDPYRAYAARTKRLIPGLW